MPELPEVECVRRSLEPHLVGATVASVRIHRGDVIGSRSGRTSRKTPTAPQREATRVAMLEGARITRLNRRGKQLAIVASSGAGFVVHLGMSGRMTLARDSDEVVKHTHVVWTLSRPKQTYTQVRFVDPRRFGFLLAFADAAGLAEVWREIGPDALALAGEHAESHAESHSESRAARGAVSKAIRGTRRAIKPALLDQAVVAGVGNIYADEACFAARLDPHRPGNSLGDTEMGRLLDAVPRVLLSAIDCGGSTLRDYADALGSRGTAQAKHAVYGRAGKACPVCGGVLAADRLGQRATVWCPRCQGSSGASVK